ncbi:DUF3592 domain-containing protein [Mesorhizobium caraganae]|uniref:DUF3592 domain-containing protein n=1 Tax=Mesorhizobium caraganae TaxID=483206 RepID=UPI00177C225D|nr:DUF3592 domain-containing protein [Mesorhizobium caraganae]MBM2711632.1 DUF3592 domain-containing protein [Mesorhizobium caraganae]
MGAKIRPRNAHPPYGRCLLYADGLTFPSFQGAKDGRWGSADGCRGASDRRQDVHSPWHCRTDRFRRSGHRRDVWPRTASATGRIVAAEYNPLIEFSTADGIVIRFNNAVHSSSWGDGDSVPVAYDPTNPQNASVDSFAGRWFLAGLAGMLGGFFLLISIVLIVLGRVLTRRIITNSKP